jgi:RND family efflux transporter MFP subunit
MSSNKRLILGSFGLVVFLGLVIVFMAGGFSDRVRPGLLVEQAKRGGTGFTVQSLERKAFERVPGSVEARETTLVSARIMSTVESVVVRAGDTVQAGDLLVSLDKRDLNARLESMLASRAAIDARLEEARRTLGRAQELLSKGLLSQADYDKAASAEAALVAERLAITENIRGIETSISYAQVKAPISGRVVDRFVEPGDLASPGALLVSLYNPASLEVALKVREDLAMGLQLGDNVRVSVPSADRSFESQVSEIVPAADRVSRSFDVTLQVLEGQGLLPGLFAAAQIPAGTEIWRSIPKALVHHLGQLNLVWVETDAGPVKRFVRLGRQEGAEVEVTAGLSDGEVVIAP